MSDDIAGCEHVYSVALLFNAPDETGPLGSDWHRPSRPAGQLLGTVEHKAVVSSDGRELASVWCVYKGKTPTLRYLMARVIRFEPKATAEVRALAIRPRIWRRASE